MTEVRLVKQEGTSAWGRGGGRGDGEGLGGEGEGGWTFVFFYFRRGGDQVEGGRGIRGSLSETGCGFLGREFLLLEFNCLIVLFHG